MRIVLVDNLLPMKAGQRLVVQRTPHLGLMAIGSVLRTSGHEVQIISPGQLFVDGAFTTIDDDFYGSCANLIVDYVPDVVGFTSIGLTFHHTLAMARALRGRAEAIPVCLGGPHATILADPILRTFREFDAVLRHEAETTVTPFMEALASGADAIDVPGASFRRGDEIHHDPRTPDLLPADSLPEPALDFYPIERMQLADLPLEAGRGCPFNCTFCSTALFFKRRHRLKTPERLVREILALRDRYGIERFSLTHDLFGLHRKHILSFAAAIKTHGVKWVCSTRLDCIDEELVQTLANSGCRHLYFGIESGSQRMQALTAKKLDLSKAMSKLRCVVGADIKCTVSFITGFPEESPEDQAATLQLLGKMAGADPKRVTPQLHLLAPEPGSPLTHDKSIRIAFDWVPPNVDVPPPRELIEDNPDVFSSFYHFLTNLPRGRTVAIVHTFTEWLRVLGPEVLTHVVLKGSGTLDRLLDWAIEDEVESKPPERIIAAAMDALLSALDGLPGDRRYLRDVIRFTAAFGGIPPAARDSRETGLAPHARVTTFDCDPFPLVRAVLKRPQRLPSSRLRMLAPTNYVLYRDADGRPSGLQLDQCTFETLEDFLRTGQRGGQTDNRLAPLVRTGLLVPHRSGGEGSASGEILEDSNVEIYC